MMSQTKNLKVLLVVVFTGLMTCVHPSWADQPKHPHKPTVQTPMTRVELLGALREGHLITFGKLPSKNRLAMAWGQVAFENGHGLLTFNHNLGNVATTKVDQPNYYNRGDGHWYRHHETFVDGAAAYWEVIKRCTAALARFDSGNPSEAARYLKRCGYFEADLDQYTKGFSNLYYYARGRVFAEEEREQQQQRQRQQELQDAANGELVRLIEQSEAARAASLDPNGY
jgi:predicted restriction endonuclease